MKIYEPYSYQYTAISWCLHRLLLQGQKGAGLFLDPGLGKTGITLAVLRTLQRLAGVRKTLIVAPLRVVYGVWPAEIQKWAQFAGLRVSIIHGKPEERIAALRKDADVYLINAEGLNWLVKDLIRGNVDKGCGIDKFRSVLGTMNLRDERGLIDSDGLDAAIDAVPAHRYPTMVGKCGLNLPFFELVVFDESSLFKTASAQRTQVAALLARQTNYRMILTGTPIPRSLEDLYSQVHLLDQGAALGKNITQYRKRYFEQLANFRGYIPKNQACVDAIYEAVAPLCLRMDADTYLDLPPIQHNDVWITMDDSARAIYAKLERDFFIEMDQQGDRVLFESEVSKYNACRGLANGGYYHTPDGTKARATHHVHDLKAAALMELHGELQRKPLLVAYQFQHDAERIMQFWRKRKRKVPPYIGSGVSPQRSTQLMNDWNAGKLDLLLAQSGSIAHGANLQFGGNDIAWFGLTNNLEHYIQFNKRLHRLGVRGTCRIHHLMMRNTVEEAVRAGLTKKDGTQTSFLDALRDYRLGYRISEGMVA